MTNLLETRKNWRKNWLYMLFTFSHADVLRRMLIHEGHPDSHDWGELICQYFDDLYLDEDYQDAILDGTISKQEFEVIKPFHFAIKSYVELPHTDTPDWTDSMLMNDTEWHEVLSLGEIAWENLKAILVDTDEVGFVQSLESNNLTI